MGGVLLSMRLREIRSPVTSQIFEESLCRMACINLGPERFCSSTSSSRSQRSRIFSIGDRLKPVEEKLDELRALFPLREGVAERFDDLVGAIAEFEDPEAIQPILELVDDRCELAGLMGSLLESLEGFAPEIYLPKFLGALPGLAKRSPGWCVTEIKRILWSPGRLLALEAAIPRLNQEQASVLRLMLGKINTPTLVQARDVLTQAIDQRPLH